VRRDSYTASLKRPSPVWLHRARAQRRAATEAVVPPPFRPTLVAADPTARPVVPHWLRLVLVAFICLGAFFRCYHLDRKVLWEDEIFATVHMLGYTEGEIVAAAPQMRIAADLQRYFHLPDAPPGWPHALIDPIRSLASEDPQHPPLYYVVGRQWAGIFGTSVMALRSLPALFGLLVLPCMYFLCREVFAARGAGLLGAALVAVSPFHVLYAQEVREYSLWTVVLLLLGLAFLRALRRPAAVSWALYGLTVACSMYVFPFSALVAVAQGVYLFALRGFRIDRVATGYLVAAVLGLAAFVPWLAIMIQAAGLARGMSAIFETHVGPLTVIGTLLRNVRGTFVDLGLFQLGSLHSTALNFALTVVIAGLVAYALAILIRNWSRSVALFVILSLGLPMLPILVRDLFSGGGLVNQSRYFIPLYLGVELTIVALMQSQLAAQLRRTRIAASTITVLLLSGGALSCAISSQAQTWSNKDYEQNRTVAALVNTAHDPVVVSDYTTSRALGLGYYLAPAVRLRLDLHCDQCMLVLPQRTDLLAGLSESGDIFLLGPSAHLLANPELAKARSDGRVHIIGVKTFSDRTHPITMFAPL
jgi:uncharacterized membrane protein